MPIEHKYDVRFFKQRSVEWFSKRAEFKLTGSKLFEAIGLESLKKQQMHFDLVMKGIRIEEELSDEVKARMDHGTKSEIHAVATLVSKILPFYCPDLKYIEECSHVISSSERPLILVSPDGSLGAIRVNSQTLLIPEYGCKFKCPVPNMYKTPVHYEIPIR